MTYGFLIPISALPICSVFVNQLLTACHSLSEQHVVINDSEVVLLADFSSIIRQISTGPISIKL